MELLGREVNVVIKKKWMKNIYFKIDDEGNILVTCPFITTNFEINMLLKKNKKALERMYSTYLKKEEKNTKVLYLGKELNYIQYNKCFIDGDTIYAPSIDKANLYLEKLSIKVFEERLKLYIDEFGNIPKFTFKVRKMKTRWGVNNFSSKSITLNTLLIHYRYECIDYVIVHELSHFYHHDHSSAFWKEVEKHYPNYKQVRKELRY